MRPQDQTNSCLQIQKQAWLVAMWCKRLRRRSSKDSRTIPAEGHRVVAPAPVTGRICCGKKVREEESRPQSCRFLLVLDRGFLLPGFSVGTFGVLPHHSGIACQTEKRRIGRVQRETKAVTSSSVAKAEQIGSNILRDRSHCSGDQRIEDPIFCGVAVGCNAQRRLAFRLIAIRHSNLRMGRNACYISTAAFTARPNPPSITSLMILTAWPGRMLTFRN